jgi:geranylgeranyl diphosphate synthase type I
MLEYFAETRQRIVGTIRRFLTDKEAALLRVNPLGPDAARRLLEFSVQGKMIRGCLVQLGWALGGAGNGETPEAVIVAGAAMELFQSGLLVHDDIMDRDLTRRGQPSIFHQYAERASREGAADPRHVGEALGICAGDVAYFLAFELISLLEAPPGVLASVLGLCARELTAVGIGQMQDVAWGAGRSTVEVNDILSMYRYKTGRYSFSLPLMTGSVMAGAANEVTAALESLGETIGLLFQIRDDELGLFGSEAETGKPVGSDIREGKKTFHYASLMAAAGPTERTGLDAIFGNPGLSDSDIAHVRELMRTLGVSARVESVTRDLEERASAAIGAFTTGRPEDRDALRGLLDFTTARRQ